MEFRHIVEVHSVDCADKGGSEEDRGPSGDLLHILVLALSDQSGIDIEDLRQCLAQFSGFGKDSGEVICDVFEVSAKLIGNSVLGRPVA